MLEIKRMSPNVLRYWARRFAEGNLDKQHGEEISELLDYVANDMEFHSSLSNEWEDWYKGPIQ
ncbi:MAG TPA: hypothetical protein DCM40_39775 [Maribacter sp.]|nr:hypothetical protein [Maribacter sp.]